MFVKKFHYGEETPLRYKISDLSEDGKGDIKTGKWQIAGIGNINCALYDAKTNVVMKLSTDTEKLVLEKQLIAADPENKNFLCATKASATPLTRDELVALVDDDPSVVGWDPLKTALEKSKTRVMGIYASYMPYGGWSLYNLLNIMSNGDVYPGHEIKERYLNLGEFQFVCNRMIDLIECLYSAGCFHGDIHTKNFVITEDGLIRLIDYDFTIMIKDQTVDTVKRCMESTTYMLCRSLVVLLMFVHGKDAKENNILLEYAKYLGKTGNFDEEEYIEY